MPRAFLPTSAIRADDGDTDRGPDRRSPAGRPRTVIAIAAAVVLGWLLLGGLGGSYTGRLAEVQKNDNASFLPTKAESTAVIDKVSALTDEETLPVIVAVEKRDGSTFTSRDQAVLGGFISQLPNLSMSSSETEGRLQDLLARGAQVAALPSADGQAALIIVPLAASAAESGSAADSPIGGAVDDIGVAARLALSGSGMTAQVGGPGGLVADFSEVFGGIDGILLVVALIVVFFILLVVYRSPILPVAVLVSAVLGLGLASLVIYPLAKNGAIELSGQSQGIMFILVVGAATDYALLLVSRLREELRNHDSTWVAVREAWRGSAEPIIASAATVALGLLCLFLAQLRNTAGLGPVGALAIAGAVLASLTFLPAVLLLCGRRIFWPFVPQVDHVHAADAVGTQSFWGRVAGLVGRHPRRVWVVTLVGLLVAAAFAPSFRAEGIQVKDLFLSPTSSVKAQEIIERHFPAGASSPVQVTVPVAKAEAAVEVLSADPGIETAYVGLTPPIPGLSPPTPPVADGLTLVQGTTRGAPDSSEAEATVTRLRASLDSVDSRALVGGQAAVNLDVLKASERDLRVIVPTILVVIFVVLCLLLRSIVAPLLLVVANVVSFAATIGIASLVFDHVLGFGGSDPSIPLYSFVFLVALGIDYSIFLMTRVREESRRRGTRPGILVGLAVTGGVITSAGVVLAATFSALSVLPLVFLVQVAFIVAFGVLLDTLIVRSLLVPAVAYDIGSPVWWPSALARGKIEEPRSRGRHAAA